METVQSQPNAGAQINSCPLPAWGAPRLLGQLYGGACVPEDAVYYWDGVYYPASSLVLNYDEKEVIMGDGTTHPDCIGIFLYYAS